MTCRTLNAVLGRVEKQCPKKEALSLLAVGLQGWIDKGERVVSAVTGEKRYPAPFT